MTKISDEKILECRRMYEEEKLTCAEIGRKTGINEATIRRRLKSLGVAIVRYPLAGKFEEREIIALYEEGFPIWKIAQQFKSSEETVSKILKKNEIKVSRNGVKPSFDNHIFDNIDTEEKAYWLGFIWADGCIVNIRDEKKNYAFELGLSIKDIEHLEKFCSFIDLDKSRIKIKSNSGGNLISKSTSVLCRVQLSNKHLWETLNSYGCCPNKTSHELFPNVTIFKSSNLIHHFIRGFFDGDGWVYLDNRNYLISGVCGQDDFLKELLSYLPKSLCKETLKISNTEVIKMLKWGGNKAITFLNYLYNDSTIYLDRKYNISAPYIRNSISKSGNIGETPEMDNPEINSEVKESESSYSVEVETK